jgi:hypothetical protein
MNANLQTQYVAFLADHGLKPREIPANAETLRAAVLEHLTADSVAAGDDVVANWLQETYAQNRQRYRSERRHPADLLVETTAEEVEQSIRSIRKYRSLLKFDVFAGEFPMGSINAEAVEVDGGFLILVDSGALVVMQQVGELLAGADADHPSDRTANATTIDGVVSALEAYLLFGDPFFGPRRVSGGLTMLLRHALTAKCRSFVVAHEYGHLIAGHFDGRVMELEQLNTNAGPIGVIKKGWSEEFEADAIAQKILLGVDDLANLDLRSIDRAYEPDELSGSVLGPALMLKAAIAAPFIFLTIDAILGDVENVVAEISGNAPAERTHPPARARMDNLLPVEHLEPKYASFINLAAVLWENYDEICGRLVKSMVDKAGPSSEASPASTSDDDTDNERRIRQ